MHKPSESVRLLDRCLRLGDWDSMAELTARLSAECPLDAEALAEYLAAIRELLARARTARAILGVSLARVRAAAEFTQTLAGQTRQDLAVPPEL